MADRYLLLISEYRLEGKHIVITAKTWKNHKGNTQKLPRKHVSECIKTERKGKEMIGVALPTWLAKDRGFLRKDKHNKYMFRIQGIYTKKGVK